MHRQPFIFLLLLLLFSCGHSPSFSKKEKQSVTDDVRQTLEEYYNQMNKSGLTAEFHYLDSSAGFFWVPPGYTTSISYDSVVRIINQNAPLFRVINNVWDSLYISPLTNELASYTGRIRSTATDTSGKTAAYSLIETGVVIKRKDGWKLLNGQTALIE